MCISVCLCVCVYLDLPQGIGAGRRRRRLSQCGSEENVEFALVLVAGQKLFLLSVKQTHHVALRERQEVTEALKDNSAVSHHRRRLLVCH